MYYFFLENSEDIILPPTEEPVFNDNEAIDLARFVDCVLIDLL